MPLFDYSCSCGCIGRLITNPDEIPNCPECGKKMEREADCKIFDNSPKKPERDQKAKPNSIA